MIVDTSNRIPGSEFKNEKNDEMINKNEHDTGTKGGQSSDFDKKEEEDMGGQDAGNMNNPQSDQDLGEES